MTGIRQCIFAALFTCLTSGTGCLVAQDGAVVSRQASVAQSKGEASWLKQTSEQQGMVTNSLFDVIFIGDSLTEFWTSIGKAVWPKEFAPLKCANCGIAGDRTEHILFRINRLDFRRARPRIFVLLMGTNNLGMTPPDPPEEVVRATLLAASLLAKRYPASRIVILDIPPSGREPHSPLRASIRRANTLLAQASLPAQASLVPIYDTFADEKDHWRDGLTLDGTHFSAEGYARLAAILAPRLKEILGAK